MLHCVHQLQSLTAGQLFAAVGLRWFLEHVENSYNKYPERSKREPDNTAPSQGTKTMGWNVLKYCEAEASRGSFCVRLPQRTARRSSCDPVTIDYHRWSWGNLPHAGAASGQGLVPQVSAELFLLLCSHPEEASAFPAAFWSQKSVNRRCRRQSSSQRDGKRSRRQMGSAGIQRLFMSSS